MYGTVKGREMHLREQGDDESLKHHPQSPGRLLEGSTQNPQGKMTEWNTALSFTHWKQDLNCNFTYSNISSAMTQNCFQKPQIRLKTGEYFSTCIQAIHPLDYPKNLILPLLHPAPGSQKSVLQNLITLNIQEIFLINFIFQSF